MQGFLKLTKSCNHFPRYYRSVLISKAGCKGEQWQKWLLNPGTSSQSEGYSSKWLIWQVCREPLLWVYSYMHIYNTIVPLGMRTPPLISYTEKRTRDQVAMQVQSQATYLHPPPPPKNLFTLIIFSRIQL